MDESIIVKNAKEYIKQLFKDDSGGHDAAHSLRVYRNAMMIADGCECDRPAVALAALLHDVDDHKLFNTQNNANARAFLESQKLSAEKIDQICEAVNSVSFSQNRGRRPDTIEGMIVQDADRLDAIGAIGIARTFAFGGEHGRPLEDSIEHFHNKLLLLKDEMNTEAAKALAEERHAFLERFLAQYMKEAGDSSDSENRS